jgi:2-polyprenyl-3-methyl-5-hydroxy-6-metoxy-1,4-benzoquinol methylase
MFERIDQCPVCESERKDHAFIVKDHMVSGESFAISRCRNCSFHYTNPRPKGDKLGAYYESENYLSHQSKQKSIFGLLYEWARNRALNQKLSWIESYAPKDKLLDYGCGAGYFMKHAEKKGWKSYGVEPSEKARALAMRDFGGEVTSSLDELEKKKFDAITLFHVLEHVPDLNETLAKLRKRLHKKGILFIALPNHDSYDAKKYMELWAAWDVPRHLYHFNPYTAKLLFKKHKLQIEATLPMKMDAYYVSLLSEQYKAGLQKPSLSTYWQAFWAGLKSNKAAQKNQNTFSSLVYVLKKK